MLRPIINISVLIPLSMSVPHSDDVAPAALTAPVAAAYFEAFRYPPYAKCGKFHWHWHWVGVWLSDSVNPLSVQRLSAPIPLHFPLIAITHTHRHTIYAYAPFCCQYFPVLWLKICVWAASSQFEAHFTRWTRVNACKYFYFYWIYATNSRHFVSKRCRVVA